jgi:hypothetical protein
MTVFEIGVAGLFLLVFSDRNPAIENTAGGTLRGTKDPRRGRAARHGG